MSGRRLASVLRSRTPSVLDLPIVIPEKTHVLSYKRSYPSGPQVQQVRLRYPYMAAQTLADSIATNADKAKTSVVFQQLSQAMGEVGTGRNARPVTGIDVKVNGVTHTEDLKSTTVIYRRGNINHGHREHKMRVINGKNGSRCTQVKLCSAPSPF